MRSTFKVTHLLWFVAAATIGIPALAASPNPRCIADAAAEDQVCRSNCREHFQAAKDICRNIDHDCADRCRADLDTCLEAPTGPITLYETCRLNCREDLVTEKARCREMHPPGTPERDQCIDRAEVTAFACRDTCRDTYREGVRDQVRLCRLAFRTCILQCPPPPTP